MVDLISYDEIQLTGLDKQEFMSAIGDPIRILVIVSL